MAKRLQAIGSITPTALEDMIILSTRNRQVFSPAIVVLPLKKI